MVNSDEAKLNGTIFESVHVCVPFVTVIVIVIVGLQPNGAITTNEFPEPVVVVQPGPEDIQLTEVTVQPPKTCDVLFRFMVLLTLFPQTTLKLKSGNKGTSVLEIIVNVQPLQVILAVTP